MRESYSTTGDQTITTVAATALGLTSAANLRPAIKMIAFGVTGTPADAALMWTVQRYTAAGTATAVVPLPSNPRFSASTTTSGSNHTVEPTYTSTGKLFVLPVNLRVPYTLYLPPGSEFVLPGTAANGVGVYTLHATQINDYQVNMLFEE